MKIYNITTNSFISLHKNKDFFKDDNEYFIICGSSEIPLLQPFFFFDESTVEVCANVDENVRLTSFDNYDFISLIYINYIKEKIVFEELNVYIGNNYVLLVVQNTSGNESADSFDRVMFNKAAAKNGKSQSLNKLLYFIFDKILSDLSNSLEKLEDNIQQVESEICSSAKNEHFKMINELRQTTYTIKKHLRPMIYITDQMLVNENNFIENLNMKYFKNIDVRVNKLFDFASSLHDVTNQLINLHDSKLTMKTNDIITKLTLITVFIGPLTVITGIYGMNFDYMPETKLPFAYPAIIIIMIIISLSIYLYMKRKKLL